MDILLILLELEKIIWGYLKDFLKKLSRFDLRNV
jgi:hypothetical protein